MSRKENSQTRGDSEYEANVYYFGKMRISSDFAPLPTKTTKKNIWPQEYRSRLFSGMFEHYSMQHKSLSAVNIPIVIDAVGRPIYMHLIARAEHLAFIDTIKEYVMTNYGKPCIEDL